MSKDKIDNLLTRGVENIYPTKKFLGDKLNSNEKITIYLGIDPTGPFLHIGHAIQLRKLSEFQELGHKIILLIGDFTAMIGDPTDKTATRKQLTNEQVLKNCKNYKRQASKILRFEGENPVELKYNREWLGKLNFEDVLNLSSHFTVQQMIERDMFENRMKDGKPIYLHEFMYPLMQGYDSVAMNIDGELGGNDQTFNMLAGRTLMKQMLNKEKFVLTMKLLEDPTGKKMGKTEGNIIALDEEPNEMFGKVMSWTDGMIIPGLELCTDVTTDEIDTLNDQMKKETVNPRDIKMRLANEIVKQYHNAKAAKTAEEYFINVFKEKKQPDEIPELKIKNTNIIKILVEAKLCSSKSDARRVIEQKGVKINDVVVEDVNLEVKKDKNGVIIQKGKRHFIKII